MTVHVIWALVVAFCALVLWDMVRRYAFATATRSLKQRIDALQSEVVTLTAKIDTLGTSTAALTTSTLPARVKQIEAVVLALKQRAEVQIARPSPFGARKAGP